MNSSNWQNIDIRLFAVAASLLLSVFSVLTSDMPNDDAYTYVRTADIFLDQGLAAAISHYTWAAYSILIGLVSMLGISLFTAAFVINSLFYALIVYSFISIVQSIDDSKIIVSLGAATVLFFPELNEYRDMVVRDIGFWGLALFGLWQFLQYYQSRELKYGVYFCIALGLAALFRSEAILYLALTPFALLFDARNEVSSNRKNLLQMLLLILGFALAGSLVLLTFGINIFSLLMEFVSVYQPFLVNAISPSESEVTAMGNAIFGEYASTFSRQYVTAVIALGLLVVLFMNVFYAISGPYFWMLVYGWHKNYLSGKHQQLMPVLAYFLINLLILVVFLYITRYLSSRYGVILALMVAMQLPFVVRHIIEKIRGSQWERFGTYFLVLFFTYCAIDSYISFGKSKRWLLDTASYVSETAQAPNTVLTNNHTIAYYSGQVEEYDEVLRMLTVDEIMQSNVGDIIAIEIFYEMTLLLDEPAVTPYLEQIARFPAEGEARAAIYRRINP